jgi:hypothetical protein
MLFKKQVKITSNKIHVDIFDICWYKFVDAVKKEFLANSKITNPKKFECDFKIYLEHKCKEHNFRGLFLIKGIHKNINIVYNILGLKLSFKYKSYFVTNYKFPYNIPNVFELK